MDISQKIISDLFVDIFPHWINIEQKSTKIEQCTIFKSHNINQTDFMNYMCAWFEDNMREKGNI